MKKNPVVYIMANKPYGTLYTGVTSDIMSRVYQHKNNITLGFTSRYNCNSLVYYERHEDMENAILREKQIKAGSRKNKIELIEKTNKNWRDLYDTLF